MHSVRVSAPTRIHFGLLSLVNKSGVQYGGAGVMVDQPRVELEMLRATETRTSGPHAARVLEFIQLWREHTHVEGDVHGIVHAAPPDHVGLGLGTQLGLAVAAALDRLFARRTGYADQVQAVGRGQRSAVGTYGFYHGGLIVEHGKSPNAALSETWQKIELPNHWRVVLIRPLGIYGLAGEQEKEAFHNLPAIPDAHQAALRTTLFDRLMPAAQQADFAAFSESVFQYGKLAGECFAASQEGAYLNTQIDEIVTWNRAFGARGVGQTSWGPTVFCWCESRENAEELSRGFRQEFSNLDAEIIVAGVENTGARIITT